MNHYYEIKKKYLSKIGIRMKSNYLSSLKKSDPIPICDESNHYDQDYDQDYEQGYNSYEHWRRSHSIKDLFSK